MREISLDRLRTLVAIADLGSFAEPARALHLAPPTVSLHIVELEARVGAPLLTRKRGEVRPSSIGETLVDRARRLLADADLALDDVQRQVQGLTGRVRLGASTGAIAHLLPQALAMLAERHPDIDVQVAVLTSQETLARLAAGTLEVGLVALPQARVAGLTIRPWRRDPVRAFLPASWPCPARITPAWLATRPLILNDGTTRLSRLTAEWFASGGHRPAPRIQLKLQRRHQEPGGGRLWRGPAATRGHHAGTGCARSDAAAAAGVVAATGVGAQRGTGRTCHGIRTGGPVGAAGGVAPLPHVDRRLCEAPRPDLPGRCPGGIVRAACVASHWPALSVLRRRG